MRIERFKHDFKRLNGIYATDKLVLFRDPLELYSLTTGKVIAQFKDLDEALHFEIEGVTLEKRVAEWTEIVFPAIGGGRGSGSGMGFGGKWPSSNGGGSGFSSADHPARMNVKTSVNRTYDDMLKAFIQTHANSDTEHGITIDGYGFTTQYIHGTSGAVAIAGGKGEIVIHNHPFDGWPTFSKEDVIHAAMSRERGIVAVSGTKGRSEETAKYAGTYSFVKGTHFNASGFVKAVNKANLSGKDYNDAVSKWLKANQKKYGYSYTYQKAK